MRDPRDAYYQDPHYYGVYNPYRSAGYPSVSASAANAAYNQYLLNQQFTYSLKYDPTRFQELFKKHPDEYRVWYHANYGQHYGTGSTVGTGPASASVRGSIAASEADRASVHSGRSSVNEEHPSMLANHSISISQQIRGLTAGLDQSQYESGVFQVRRFEQWKAPISLGNKVSHVHVGGGSNAGCHPFGGRYDAA